MPVISVSQFYRTTRNVRSQRAKLVVAEVRTECICAESPSSSTPGWRILAPVNLQTVVLRHEPDGVVSATGAVLDPGALNAHTLSWVDAVNTSGAALVTPSLLDGSWAVRVSIGAERTERADVEELWRLLQQAASS